MKGWCSASLSIGQRAVQQDCRGRQSTLQHIQEGAPDLLQPLHGLSETQQLRCGSVRECRDAIRTQKGLWIGKRRPHLIGTQLRQLAETKTEISTSKIFNRFRQNQPQLQRTLALNPRGPDQPLWSKGQKNMQNSGPKSCYVKTGTTSTFTLGRKMRREEHLLTENTVKIGF